MEPYSHQPVYARVHTDTFTRPGPGYLVPMVFLVRELTVTDKARSTTRVLIQTCNHTCVEVAGVTLGAQQSRQVTLVSFASLSAISGTFNSLFKVLFTFPSWYLFAIGLETIFSFR